MREDADVCAIGLEVAVVGPFLAVHALHLARLVVVQEGDGHDEVIDQAAAGDEVDEPGDGGGGPGADLQEGKEGEDHHDAKAVDGDAAFVAVAEEVGGSAFEGQTVEGASGTEGIRVSGGEDGGEDEGVHDMREHPDAEVLHGHDIRGACCAGGIATATEVDLHEGWVVVGDHDGDGQGADNEEDTEAVVDGLEGGFDVDAGALRFGGDHGDVLGADDGEAGRPERGQEAFEAT